MNILVRSTYRQTDGWGRAAKDYLKAFCATGHTVRAQEIILSSRVGEAPDFAVPPENGFVPDVFFQQCLPEYMEKTKHRNIGFCFTESRHIEKTGWVEHLNKMDDVWVATPQETVNLLKSGVKNVNFVGMPMELVEGKKPDYLQELVGGRYTFYFLGEYVERKNIQSLIMAYYREFSKDDNTLLLIKTNYGNLDPSVLKNHIQQELTTIQDRMRLYSFNYHYPDIMFITENWSDQEIANLHATCDCFVNPSRGESTCRPLVDAGYHNNPVICTAGIGAADCGFPINLIDSIEVPCSAFTPPLKYLYTGWETWMEPSIISMQRLMREEFIKKEKVNTKDIINGRYSYESVAKRINNILR